MEASTNSSSASPAPVAAAAPLVAPRTSLASSGKPTAASRKRTRAEDTQEQEKKDAEENAVEPEHSEPIDLTSSDSPAAIGATVAALSLSLTAASSSSLSATTAVAAMSSTLQMTLSSNSSSDNGAQAASPLPVARVSRSSVAAAAAVTFPASATSSAGDTTEVVVTKVRRTGTITQPTMERFSRRVAESAEVAAARELKQNPFHLEWRQQGSLLYLDSRADAPHELRIKPNSRVAAFDMDSTLLRTASGRKFPTGRNDWRWLLPCIPAKLKELHEQGVKIVVFSNQNGISTGKQSAAEIKGKILDIIKDCGVAMQAFVASADDLYRKPATDAWTHFATRCNGGVTVDLARSIFVGDAAGRPAGWDGQASTKRDFSASDRKFAFNIGLPFATPEEYFLNKPAAKFSWGGVDPTAVRTLAASAVAAPMASVKPSRTMAVAPVNSSTAAAASSASSSASAASTSLPSRPVGPFHSPTQELVVFVGLPASGKSTFARTHFVPHGYVHVNQDTLKSKEKCVKAAGESLAQGKSAVVDNTNPSAELRALYIKQARTYGVPVRCFHFITSEDVAKHLNMFREKLTNGAHRHVPRIAYSMYKKRFEAPQMKEGFKEVVQMDFTPHFEANAEGERAKKLFYQVS